MVIEEKTQDDVQHRYACQFGLNCLEPVKDHSDLIVLTSDVSTSAGLDRFIKQYQKFYRCRYF